MKLKELEIKIYSIDPIGKFGNKLASTEIGYFVLKYGPIWRNAGTETQLFAGAGIGLDNVVFVKAEQFNPHLLFGIDTDDEIHGISYHEFRINARKTIQPTDAQIIVLIPARLLRDWNPIKGLIGFGFNV